MGKVFGIVRDYRAYLALLHMLVAPLLALFYFLWLITAVPLMSMITIWAAERAVFGPSHHWPNSSAGMFALSVMLTIAAFLTLPYMNAAVLWAVRLLLSAKIKVVDTLRISQGAFWIMALYMLVTLLLGGITFMVGLVGSALSLGIVAGCLWSLITNDASHIRIDEVPWLAHLLHTAPGLILFTILGALMFVALLHLARGAAWIQAQIVQGMLPRE